MTAPNALLTDRDHEDPWSLWLDMAEADVDGQVSPEIAALLRRPENLMRWLRALVSLQGDVNAEISEARLRIDALRPAPGERASAEYHKARAAQAAAHIERASYRAAVDDRLREARFLMAEARLSERASIESVMSAVVRAVDLFDRGEPERARSTLAAVMADVEAATGTPAT